jgi:flagellar protein FlaG
MIIQSTLTTNQAIQPGRTNEAASVKPTPAAPAAAPAPDAPTQVSSAELQQAVSTINQALQASTRNLEFSVDTSTERTVVKVVDTDTGELIRQLPSDATLAISRGIAEFQQGLLLEQKA